MLEKSSREIYIENPDLFECSWKSELDVPTWMTDYNEKLAAYADTDGRMMSVFHRGDTIYYPENSIEAIISAMKMGADAVEIDPCLTKDNIVVLMHDLSDLSSTTDWLVKNGKNGLPTSKKVCDWTFSELQKLHLVMKDGTLTDYIIPTFEEALHVCNGRTKLMLDKEEWDWNRDVYPLIEKYAAWDTCIPPRTYSFSYKNSIAEAIKSTSGVSGMYAFEDIRISSCAEWKKSVLEMKSSGTNYIAYWPTLRVTKTLIEESLPGLSQVAGTIRIFGQNHSSVGGNEIASHWNYLWENGVNIVLTDEGLNLQKYIAENFEPTKY